MRQLQARKDGLVARGFGVSGWTAWPDCEEGTDPGLYPRSGFYDESRDDATTMGLVRSSILGNFQALIDSDAFVNPSKADLSQYTTESTAAALRALVVFTMSDFPDLQGTGGSLTDDEVINAAQSAVAELHTLLVTSFGGGWIETDPNRRLYKSWDCPSPSDCDICPTTTCQNMLDCLREGTDSGCEECGTPLDCEEAAPGASGCSYEIQVLENLDITWEYDAANAVSGGIVEFQACMGKLHIDMNGSSQNPPWNGQGRLFVKVGGYGKNLGQDYNPPLPPVDIESNAWDEINWAQLTTFSTAQDWHSPTYGDECPWVLFCGDVSYEEPSAYTSWVLYEKMAFVSRESFPEGETGPACGEDEDIGSQDQQGNEEQNEGDAGDSADGACGGGGGGPGGGGPGPDVPDDAWLNGTDQDMSGVPGWIQGESGKWYPKPVYDVWVPVSLETGHKREGATDLTIALPGQDLNITRWYSSDYALYSPTGSDDGLVGANWSLSFFRQVAHAGGTGDITIYDPARRKYTFVHDTNTNKWVRSAGGGQQEISDTQLTIGGTAYDVWKLEEPGGWYEYFYHYESGGNTNPNLDGLLARREDVWGNGHTYEYTLFGTNSDEPRLTGITLHDNAGPVAEIVLTWRVSGTAIGRLSKITVNRFDATGARVVTDMVKYRYKGDSDLTVHADVGSDNDLIQVENYSRMNKPYGGDDFRVTVTQYRYHDGNWTTGETDPRLNVGGKAHQLKHVIAPEQMEYYAQRQGISTPTPRTVVDEAEDLLALADDATSFTDDGSTTRAVVDMAAKIVSYDNDANLYRVAEEYIQSACGCSGSTQGVRYDFEHFTWTDSSVPGLTVKVTERNAGSSGDFSEIFRYLYFDLKRLGGGAGDRSYPITMAIKKPSGSDVPWAGHWRYDSTRRVERFFMPSAVTAYDPCDADDDVPSITISTNSGLAYAYSYTTDHRITQTRIGNGDLANFGDFTILQKVAYPASPGTNERKHLPNAIYNYQTSGTSDADGDNVEKTTFTYGFHTISGYNDALAYFKASVEAELESENGPSGTGNIYDTYILFDDATGEVAWTRDADNSLTYRTFDPATGGVTKIVRNADPTAPGGDSSAALNGSDYGGVTITGWGNSSDGGELVSTTTRDLQGRTVKTTAPGGTNSYTSREMRADSHRPNMVYYSIARLPPLLSDDTFDGPAAVTWHNADGDVTRSSEFELSASGYDPESFAYAFAQNGSSQDIELSRTMRDHTLSGLVEESRAYHDVMGARFATEADRYDATTYTYDDRGRVETVTNANGTVVEYTLYDALDRLLKIESGTGSGTVVLEERFYDHTLNAGNPVQGRGDGNLTFLRRYTGESTGGQRDTIRSFDYRDRMVSVENPDEPHEVIQYDNLDRVTARALFKDGSTGGPPSDINDSGRLVDRGLYSEIEYSQRGLAYVQRVAIDPTASANPSQLDYLETHSWFDEVGRTIAQWAPNRPATKRVFDGLGRAKVTSITDRGGDAAPGGTGNYADAAGVGGDVVFEQVEITYDTDATRWAGNPYLVASRRRNHDASYSTETGTLDDDNSVVSYVGSYYDDADRLIRTVNWGTNHDDGFVAGGESPIDDTTYNWPPSSAPGYDTSPYNTGDTIVTAQAYNTRGVVESTIDSEGQVTKRLYDDRGRTVATIENYKNATVTWSSGRWNAANIEQNGSAGGNDEPGSDRVTSLIYDGVGNVNKQTAHEPNGSGGDTIQMTEYVYGVTEGSNANDTDSLIDSNNLLKEIRYPNESTGNPGTTDEYKVKYAYNRLGELRAVTDQNGTIHTYDRDDLGRVTKDWVTTFGTDVDGQGTNIDTTVKGIQVGYDGYGRVLDVESLDSSSAVLNGVEFSYNKLWQVTHVYQDTEGDVTYSGPGSPTGDTVVVQYAYSEAETSAGNHSRLESMTYPDGSLLAYSYGSSDADGRASRATKLSLGPDAQSLTDVVNYDHVGLGMFSHVDYPVPDLQLDRTASHDGKRRFDAQTPTQAAGTYPAWDRFGRVARHMWVDGGFEDDSGSAFPTLPPLVELTHGYDRASNRLTRYDERPGSRMPNWEFEYGYDGLDRLNAADRGEWDGSTFTPGAGTQEWVLDILGNWTEFNHDKNGTNGYGDNGEQEDRTHNEANEITTIALNGLTGSPFTQHRDKAGNWTRNKRSAASNIEYTHDAWNRLVKVRQIQTIPATTLGQYEYNGLHWRTVRKFPKSGNAEERRMFYSASWQLLEERIDSDNATFAEEKCAQTVWGLRYIDDALLRRLDTNQDYDYADSGERTDYFITDPQFSVVAVVSDGSKLQERAVYSPYGEARHHFPADIDGDGDVDSSDINWFLDSGNRVAIDNAAYNPDGDLNRSGAVDTADVVIAYNWNGSAALASGLISDADGPDNPFGYCGYVFNAETKNYTVRFRHYEPVTGRWMERDPLGPLGSGPNAYQAVEADPVSLPDPLGLMALVSGPPEDELSFLDDAMDPYGYSVRFSPLAHQAGLNMKEAVDILSCYADYSECVLECIANNPDKFLNALQAAGFAVGKDVLEDVNFWLALPFMFFEIDAVTGEAGRDDSEIAALLWEAGFAAAEQNARATGAAACAMHESATKALELWARNGGANPKQQQELLALLEKAFSNGQSAFRKGFQASGLRAVGKGASKANAIVTTAYEVGVALKGALEQAGEDCEAECGTCPWASGTEE